MNKIYIIKNLSPWMINELKAFSQEIDFRLVLLRKPSPVYRKDIQYLINNNVDIRTEPYCSIIKIKRLLFSLYLVFFYLRNFQGVKNFVFGIKSVWWFLRLCDDVIPEDSSIHAQFATQSSIIALFSHKYYKNVKYFFTIHAYDIFYKNKWLPDLINNSYKVFSISDFNIKYIKNKYQNIPLSKIETIRLGVSPPNQNNTNKKTIEKTKSLTIGFLGTWEVKKGIIYLIQSFEHLLQKGYDIKLILAGDGSQKKEIINYLKERVLEKHVELPGYVYDHEKHLFYNDIDIFVLPSIMLKNDMEGIPVVLMEALSYGIPIISTNISGIPEICINGYNGFLIPPGDVTALEQAILNFYIMENKRFMEFKRNALKSSGKYNILINSRKKIKLMGWAQR